MNITGLLSPTEFSFELTQVWARPEAWGTQGQGQEVLEKLKFRAQSLGGQDLELPWAGDIDTCRQGVEFPRVLPAASAILWRLAGLLVQKPLGLPFSFLPPLKPHTYQLCPRFGGAQVYPSFAEWRYSAQTLWDCSSEEERGQS